MSDITPADALRELGDGDYPDYVAAFEKKFWSKVNKTETCWLWTGPKQREGYGTIWRGGRMPRKAHRVAYELLVGPIPPGAMLDHLCHVPACVRPDHLAPVTNAQNSQNRRGADRDSSTGIRGVYREERRNKWLVQARKDGKQYFGGRFDDINDAEKAAIALRKRLGMHMSPAPAGPPVEESP